MYPSGALLLWAKWDNLERKTETPRSREDAYILVSAFLFASALNPPSQFKATVNVAETSRAEIQWHIYHDVGIETSHSSNIVCGHSDMLAGALNEEEIIIASRITKLGT